jgi:protochlorophyllide reductase
MDALGQSVAMGALPILYAATAPGVSGDDYFGPRWLGGLRGRPAHAARSRFSTNDELGATLDRVVTDLIDGATRS